MLGDEMDVLLPSAEAGTPLAQFLFVKKFKILCSRPATPRTARLLRERVRREFD